MKFNFFKRGLAIAFVGALAFIFHACQKKYLKVAEQSSLHEQAINAMKERIKREGAGITTFIPVDRTNPRIPLQLIGRDGQFVSTTTIQNNNVELTADYVCDMPGLINPYAAPPVITRTYDCGYGYKYTVSYDVSAPFNIVASNPDFPSIATKGIIRLKRANTSDNSGTNVAYMEDNIVGVIKSLGEDPLNNEHFLFNVTFTTAYIATSVIEDGVYIEPRATFASDCDLYPGVGSGTVVRYIVWGTTIDPNDEPCSRTDKCFINPSMSGIYGSIGGSDVLGECAALGFVVSQWHQFEYREITGFTPGSWGSTGIPGAWATVPVTSSFGAPVATGMVANWDVLVLSSGFASNNVYEFRYRNYRQNSSSPVTYCWGEWSLPQRYMFY